ncbi:lipocalin-like domain-containing protein [Pontiellaceae bacterium B12227]|nr:lipocalin-like domain-containing protein [Pontiellaceae bacterium B12227]
MNQRRYGLMFLTLWLVGAVCSDSLPRTEAGFRIPTTHPEFTFPRDHGSHPEFLIEWWYITGHLRNADNQRYGFQATFFRYAMTPYGPETFAPFGTNQLFMAHMALSDIDGNQFYHEERLNRDGWDAKADTDDLDLRNGNWTLRRTDGETMELRAGIRADIEFEFQLQPLQPKVFFGKDSVSRKGADPSACSWYITFPRLGVSGTLRQDGKNIPVTGEAWMDHEISSSQLGHEQVGWDWLSVRMADESELMVYILRDVAGNPDPHSTLVWIDPAGQLHAVGSDQFEWSESGSWTSPDTGATYPIDVRLKGVRPDGSPFDFAVKPLMRNQELVGELGGISYWEGACDIYENDQPVGEAYMELTGYSESLEDNL